jgi:hypothetical protein
MKNHIKILLAASIFLFTNLSTNAQYRPFLANSTSWHTYHIGLGVAASDQAFILNDVLIDTVTYTRIDKYGDNQDFNLMREDTTERKVYLLNPDSTEALVYDFSLQPGDTFFTEAIGEPTWPSHALVLDSITNNLISPNNAGDTIITYFANPRIFYFSTGTQGLVCTWIEGAGSLGGFNSFYRSEGADILLCHFYSVAVQDFHRFIEYSVDSTRCEGTYNPGIASNPIPGLQFSIYPNPASDKITIDVTASQGNITSAIEIVDILGRTVHSESILIQNSSYTVNTSEWEAGVYSVIFSNGNKRSAQKVIITSH